jgi:two-component system sensor histidine kinase QseC
MQRFKLLTMSSLVPEAASHNEWSTMSLPKITREVLAMLAPEAIEKQIELVLEADETTPTFLGNPTAMSILIRNLVDNAIRYCMQNGLVVVKVYHKKNEVILEVHDNGPGIPRELRSRVFERFFRVLGHKSPGSGLGLSIVQQITKLHHGNIKIRSPNVGTGLIVTVSFPYHDTPHERHGSVSPESLR